MKSHLFPPAKWPEKTHTMRSVNPQKKPTSRQTTSLQSTPSEMATAQRRIERVSIRIRKVTLK